MARVGGGLGVSTGALPHDLDAAVLRAACGVLLGATAHVSPNPLARGPISGDNHRNLAAGSHRSRVADSRRKRAGRVYREVPVWYRRR